MAAAAYADSRVGSQGYGNNGCTAWVRDFLLHANHMFGRLMQDGSQGNLMWVPNIMDWAKENGLWKEPEEGGAMGDICLLETNYCPSDGPDHVVIACGDGQYWGNSSSRNRIVKSSIAVATFASYSNMVKKVISPYFREKGITLKELTAKDIQDFYLKELEMEKPCRESPPERLPKSWGMPGARPM